MIPKWKREGLTLPPCTREHWEPPSRTDTATPHCSLGSGLLALPFHPLLAGDSKIGSQNLLDTYEVCDLVQGHLVPTTCFVRSGLSLLT